MLSPISELSAADETGLDAAATAARTLIETALEHVTPTQREQFWNAIGLYYSTRRHPGSADAAASLEAVAP